MYRSYVLGATVPRHTLPPALFWDTEDPYHYVRLRDDTLIVGGEDHKCGQNDDAGARFARLEAWARERFASMQDVEFRWSGQIIETIDRLAFIGPESKGSEVHRITGDSGMAGWLRGGRQARPG